MFLINSISLKNMLLARSLAIDTWQKYSDPNISKMSFHNIVYSEVTHVYLFIKVSAHMMLS